MVKLKAKKTKKQTKINQDKHFALIKLSRDKACLNEATSDTQEEFTIYLANVSESCVYNNKLIDTSAEQLFGQTLEQSIGTLCFAQQTESRSGPVNVLQYLAC